jgi:1,4-alpha-glucan branching enzyme
MNAASQRPGMGAIPFQQPSQGTTFRVWLPFASAVFVSGTFNQWSTDKNPLFSENNGYWSADITNARISDQYRYVIAGPDIAGVQWRTDPYCRSVESTEGNGMIVTDDFDWGKEVFIMPAWNELVIYELHVASFYERKLRVPGDFTDIIHKLDYLLELGINAIEIMPIFGFPQVYSLGYNPALPFDIESYYGNPHSFKQFIQAAHQKGIAVILDIVLNHFGPADLDSSLLRPDGWSQNGMDGIYFYNDWRGNTAFGPRPDYGRPEVRSFLSDNVSMWLYEYRVDGLRFDSTVNIRNAFGNNNDPAHDLADGWNLLVAMNAGNNAQSPWKITIAEDLQDNAWITRPTGSAGAGFDSQWNSYYYWRLYNVIVAANDEDRNMNDLHDALTHSFDGDAFQSLSFFNNHDQCAQINNNFRLPERIWMGHADSWVARKRHTLAAAILFTSPGIPMFFQGDEFLEWGSWDPTREIDWSKTQTFSGIWDCFQSLIRLRRNWFNNTSGLRGQFVNFFHVNNQNKMVAYHRWENGGPGDDTVVVANFANQSYESYTIGFPRAGIWYVRFNSDWNGYSSDFSNQSGYDTTAGNPMGQGGCDGLPYQGNVGIGPYTVLILSQ